nr:hypothetical protein [Lysinibacillus parviboronicapiens]
MSYKFYKEKTSISWRHTDRLRDKIKLPTLQTTQSIKKATIQRNNHQITHIYARRKETIDRVFAMRKKNHDIRWTTLRWIKIVAGAVYFCCHVFDEAANGNVQKWQKIIARSVLLLLIGAI